MIEGNLYSPQASAMISFVLLIEKNPYGQIDTEIFIEVSDYILTTLDNQTEKPTKTDDKGEKQLAITHYLFAALLLVIVRTRKTMVDSASNNSLSL